MWVPGVKIKPTESFFDAVVAPSLWGSVSRWKEEVAEEMHVTKSLFLNHI